MSPLESSEAADASTVPGARRTGEETLRPGQPLGRGRQPTGRPGPEAGWRRLCLSGTSSSVLACDLPIIQRDGSGE